MVSLPIIANTLQNRPAGSCKACRQSGPNHGVSRICLPAPGRPMMDRVFCPIADSHSSMRAMSSELKRVRCAPCALCWSVGVSFGMKARSPQYKTPGACRCTQSPIHTWRPRVVGLLMDDRETVVCARAADRATSEADPEGNETFWKGVRPDPRHLAMRGVVEAVTT